MAIRPATKPAAGPADRGLRIVSRPPRFLRCGREFGPEPRTIPLSELTDEEVERLKAEPLLVVIEVDIPAQT